GGSPRPKLHIRIGRPVGARPRKPGEKTRSLPPNSSGSRPTQSHSALPRVSPPHYAGSSRWCRLLDSRPTWRSPPHFRERRRESKNPPPRLRLGSSPVSHLRHSHC